MKDMNVILADQGAQLDIAEVRLSISLCSI
jgi:hypothetical protein